MVCALDWTVLIQAAQAMSDDEEREAFRGVLPLKDSPEKSGRGQRKKRKKELSPPPSSRHAYKKPQSHPPPPPAASSSDAAADAAAEEALMAAMGLPTSLRAGTAEGNQDDYSVLSVDPSHVAEGLALDPSPIPSGQYRIVDNCTRCDANASRVVNCVKCATPALCQSCSDAIEASITQRMDSDQSALRVSLHVPWCPKCFAEA